MTYFEELKSKNSGEMNVAIGTVVRTYRKKLGLDQKELAEKLGITQSYISNIERGTREVSVGVFLRLKAFLGFKVEEIEELLKSSDTRYEEAVKDNERWKLIELAISRHGHDLAEELLKLYERPVEFFGIPKITPGRIEPKMCEGSNYEGE